MKYKIHLVDLLFDTEAECDHLPSNDKSFLIRYGNERHGHAKSFCCFTGVKNVVKTGNFIKFDYGDNNNTATVEVKNEAPEPVEIESIW